MQRLKYVLIAVGVICLLFTLWSVYRFFIGIGNHDITVNTSRTAVIQQIRALNRLETASFTIEKVIDAGTNGNAFSEFLYGDRILLIAHGEVIAGFNLASLQDNDIQVNGKSVTITLPPPSILLTTLDNDQTRVYDRKQGLLSRGNKDLESQARNAATQSIQSAACKGNILLVASDNARKQLTALLSGLGFSTVSLTIPSGSCS